jgi:glycosyltransferase involved in cell wall biosynthesis
MPVYNPELSHLNVAIESVLNQSYSNWELCIVDDNSQGEDVRRLLDSFAERDSRIVVGYRTKNGHISAASNDALDVASGDYVTFLDHDDELVPWAIATVIARANRDPQIKMFYSDEAVIDTNSTVLRGHLKGGLNRTLAWSNNYFCHLTVYSKDFLEKIGPFKLGFEGAQDYDLALRAIEGLQDHEVQHIPEVLYFWRAGENSTASSINNKPYAQNAGRQAVAEHLKRIGIDGEVEVSQDIPTAFRVRVQIVESENRVSVITPSRDNHKMLAVCVDSLLEKTNYENFEVIIVDNGSREEATKAYLSKIREHPKVTVLTIDAPFNYSKLNNAAAKIATGRHLLLLNDDTQVINADWMREMVSFSQLPFVGAVGAKLLYPDSRVQHAGVILGLGSIAGHAHKLLHSKDPGYAGRAVLHQDFMAVTGACLMIEAETFWKVSGLDEQLAVSLNDVDFCLRVHQLGLRNVFTPHAQLIHHESVSRGSDSSPENISRAWEEIDFMRKRWGALLDNDPYYSVNFSNSSSVYNFSYPPRNQSPNAKMIS